MAAEPGYGPGTANCIDLSLWCMTFGELLLLIVVLALWTHIYWGDDLQPWFVLPVGIKFKFAVELCLTRLGTDQ